MELKTNQAALILEAAGDGEIIVEIESPDMSGFSIPALYAARVNVTSSLQLSSRKRWSLVPPTMFSRGQKGLYSGVPWPSPASIVDSWELCSQKLESSGIK